MLEEFKDYFSNLDTHTGKALVSLSLLGPEIVLAELIDSPSHAGALGAIVLLGSYLYHATFGDAKFRLTRNSIPPQPCRIVVVNEDL